MKLYMDVIYVNDGYHQSESGVAELLGHSSVETTMICTHVMYKGGCGVKSPPDGMGRGG